ncbi:MAG: GNAT family N-acetyltransferase [Betaproteobacteria bacterium]|nr:GNAT family N-acetyltransferase [Betaproteobacteria bacterium]
MKLERNIRAASLADWPSIAALLNEAVLPLAGAEVHLDDFVVMDEGDRMVGVAGLERYGHVALLRSVVVRAAHRHTGIGRQMFDALCAKARRDEVRGLYLLTTTAAP